MTDMNPKQGDHRPRLVAMKVPWCTADRNSKITLLISEATHEVPTEVTFLAYVIPRRGAGYEVHAIRLVFEDAAAARLIPGENGVAGDPLAYQQDVEEDGWNNHKTKYDDWQRTGICSFPGFYEVRPSPWMGELKEDDDDLRHYLILGGSSSVEILARDWNWESLEVIPGAAPPLAIRPFE